MKRLAVAIFDMQPITPAIGGGRQRILGMYHALGERIDVTYLGSYDWRGEAFRDQRLTPGLREICVPLSSEHHAAAEKLSRDLGGKVVIDAMFSAQAGLSRSWIDQARRCLDSADVVVFSHPWAYAPLKPHLRPDQLLVYDAQNVESFLKAEYFGLEGPAADVVREVVRNEYDTLRHCHLVLCCSEDDASQFARIFDLPHDKFRIAPNGAFTRRQDGARDSVDTEGGGRPDAPGKPIAVFMGSQYGPNAEAARFIATRLALRLPAVSFVLIGGVDQALAGEAIPGNVTLTGVVSDQERDAWLAKADVALNPMAAGSGTNVKMFDYLAAGLPILTSAIGARGICSQQTAPAFIRIVPLERFADELPPFLSTLSGPAVSAQAREYVDRRFSWERISAGVGEVLAEAHRGLHSSRSARKKILMLTTWNIRCGIGEHSKYLADGFRSAGHEVVIYGNHLEGHDPIGFESDLGYPVVRGWTWDNRTWNASALDETRYREVLANVGADCVIVQHHTAYMPDRDYSQAVRIAQSAGIPVAVEMHDPRNAAPAFLNALLAGRARVFVHDEAEQANLPSTGESRPEVLPLPVYRPSRRQPVGETSTRATPGTVAGFGFLRPYKGVHIAIEAMAIVRRDFPDVEYRGWHALYPDAESERYYEQCMKLARELGVSDIVSIETRFAPIDDVIAGLAGARVVLLPYEPSREGASAAANIALAAERPLVVSASDIFRPLASVAITVRKHDPEAYARNLISMLGDAHKLAEYAAKARMWTERNSYPAAAARMVASVCGSTVERLGVS